MKHTFTSTYRPGLWCRRLDGVYALPVSFALEPEEAEAERRAWEEIATPPNMEKQDNGPKRDRNQRESAAGV